MSMACDQSANSLNPDKDWLSVVADLGPNSLQRLPTDDKSPLAMEE